ncbi:MAG: hypothetical protein B7X77_09440, partial [Caulobacter sp. 39-67-4]
MSVFAGFLRLADPGADMGDARSGKRTPIDLVMEHGGAPDATDAALWLCDHLGRDPASLGWQDRLELEREGAEIAARLSANDDGTVQRGPQVTAFAEKH